MRPRHAAATIFGSAGARRGSRGASTGANENRGRALRAAGLGRGQDRFAERGVGGVGVGVAGVGVDGEHAREDGVDGGRDGQTRRAERRARAAVEERGASITGLQPFVGRAAADELEEHRAEREHVGARTDRTEASLELLGGGEQRVDRDQAEIDARAIDERELAEARRGERAVAATLGVERAELGRGGAQVGPGLGGAAGAAEGVGGDQWLGEPEVCAVVALDGPDAQTLGQRPTRALDRVLRIPDQRRERDREPDLLRAEPRAVGHGASVQREERAHLGLAAMAREERADGRRHGGRA